jgi:uncharacterized protein
MLTPVSLNLSFVMQVRKPSFDFSRVDKYYYGNNVWATHVMNALHVLVPIGEVFFIRAVRAMSDQAPAEQKGDLKKFLGQESVHDQLHRQFWQRLREHGLPIDSFAQFFTATAIETLEPMVRQVMGEKFLLSATVGFEHYTAALADTAFAPGSKLLVEMQKEVADLMGWHAAEEIEHKSVAFNLLREVDDGYLLRAGGMVVASTLLTLYTLLGTAWFISGDREITLNRLWRDFWELPRIAGNLLPALIQHNVEYFMPDFHPDRKDNYYMAADKLKELGMKLAS